MSWQVQPSMLQSASVSHVTSTTWQYFKSLTVVVQSSIIGTPMFGSAEPASTAIEGSVPPPMPAGVEPEHWTISCTTQSKPSPQSADAVQGSVYLYVQWLSAGTVVHCGSIGSGAGHVCPSGHAAPPPALHTCVAALVWQIISAPHSSAAPSGSHAFGVQ
jgi:hypothetical protein